jgi:hypothetical protein
MPLLEKKPSPSILVRVWTCRSNDTSNRNSTIAYSFDTRVVGAAPLIDMISLAQGLGNDVLLVEVIGLSYLMRTRVEWSNSSHVLAPATQPLINEGRRLS